MFVVLGRLTCRWRWAVVAVWAAVLLVGIGIGRDVFGRLSTESGLRGDAESVVPA